jgi:hypothetical protein
MRSKIQNIHHRNRNFSRYMPAYCFHCLASKIAKTTACSGCGRVPKTPRQKQLSDALASRNFSVEQFELIRRGLALRDFKQLPKDISVYAASVYEEEQLRADNIQEACESLARERAWEANNNSHRREPSMVYGFLVSAPLLFIGGVCLFGSFSAPGSGLFVLGSMTFFMGLIFACGSFIKFIKLWKRTTPDASTKSDWQISSLVIEFKEWLGRFSR